MASYFKAARFVFLSIFAGMILAIGSQGIFPTAMGPNDAIAMAPTAGIAQAYADTGRIVASR